MLGLIGLLLTGLLVALAALTVYTSRMLTHPPRRTYASAVARGRPGDPGELPPQPSGPVTWRSWECGPERTPVWEIDGLCGDGPAFVLTHGWGDSRIGGLSRIGALLPIASRIMLWDLPGHGEARGRCSLGVRERAALETVLDHLKAESDPRFGRVVLFGWSLGAGLSIGAAVDRAEVVGVIAESPYRRPVTPARRMLEEMALPWRVNLTVALWLTGVREGVGPGWAWSFDRLADVQKLQTPLLVLHGASDTISPVEDGRALAEAAPRGRIVEIENAGHHGLWTDGVLGARCGAAVGEFVRGL